MAAQKSTLDGCVASAYLFGKSAAVAFDTLKFVETPESGGFSQAQAKASSQELATRADLVELRASEQRLETKRPRI